MPNYITPDTDLATLERHTGPYSSCRTYFFDAITRQELVDHPCNGMITHGWHGMVTYEGRFCDGTIRGLDGVAWIDGVGRRVEIGPESFDGRKIAIKQWTPSEHGDRGTATWNALAHGDGSEPAAAQARNRRGREWIADWKAGKYN